jgi:DNA-binding response OmpR family regulator
MARILIIDDDDVTRLKLGALLEKDEHDVHYAPDGDVGMKLYERRRFDLVLVDLVMPKKNGLRTIREIEELDPNARIIAMTGMDPENLDLAEDFGAVRTLTKPIEPAELKLAVQSVLRISRGWDGIEIGWK